MEIRIDWYIMVVNIIVFDVFWDCVGGVEFGEDLRVYFGDVLCDVFECGLWCCDKSVIEW